MSIFQSLIADPTDFMVTSPSGINYIAQIDDNGQQFLATLIGGGLRKSLDSGTTWGPIFGVGPVPFGTIFRMPLAVGAVAVGRLFATAFQGTTDAIYVSDDGGNTWATKTMASDLGSEAGHKILQTVGPDKRIIVKRNSGIIAPDSGLLRLDFSLDGGDTWSFSTFGTVLNGIAIEQRNDNSLILFGLGSASSIMEILTSVNEGASFTGFGTGPNVGAQKETRGFKSDYHKANNEIGVAFVDNSEFIRFFTFDATNTLTLRWTQTTGAKIASLDHVVAIQGIDKKWTITVITVSGTSVAYVSDDGDYTNFTVLKAHSLIVPGEGIIGNVPQFGISP